MGQDTSAWKRSSFSTVEQNAESFIRDYCIIKLEVVINFKVIFNWAIYSCEKKMKYLYSISKDDNPHKKIFREIFSHRNHFKESILAIISAKEFHLSNKGEWFANSFSKLKMTKEGHMVMFHNKKSKSSIMISGEALRPLVCKKLHHPRHLWTQPENLSKIVLDGRQETLSFEKCWTNKPIFLQCHANSTLLTFVPVMC